MDTKPQGRRISEDCGGLPTSWSHTGPQNLDRVQAQGPPGKAEAAPLASPMRRGSELK